MAKTSGLVKRGGVYYYRARVPLDLVSVFNKKEIKESLKTKEHAEAKRRMHERAIYWDAQFDQARQVVQLEQKPSTKILSPQAALKLVQVYVAIRIQNGGLGDA